MCPMFVFSSCYDLSYQNGEHVEWYLLAIPELFAINKSIMFKFMIRIGNVYLFFTVVRSVWSDALTKRWWIRSWCMCNLTKADRNVTLPTILVNSVAVVLHSSFAWIWSELKLLKTLLEKSKESEMLIPC